MALPLPKVVADVEPGGGIVTGMRGANALTASNIENAINRIKLQYAPTTIPAEAASKLAYANLMGPQFLAKLMGNPDILANMPNAKGAIQNLTNTAIGVSGNPITQQPANNPQKQNPFSYGAQPAAQQQNALNYNPQTQPQTQQSNYAQPPELPNSATVPMRTTPNPQMTVDNTGGVQLANNYPANDVAENSGKFQGIKEEGKEAGKLRADDLQKLGDQYESGLSMNDKYKEFAGLVNNPAFRQMRENIPFFQDKQLTALAAVGTPEQKELIGQFKTTANEIMGDVIRSFGAQKFRGESDIAKNMKISDSDSFNVIVGKLQASMLYKNLQMERIKKASDLMESQHISKRKALEISDKQIDGDRIRKDIATKLDYSVNIRQKQPNGTYKTISVPVSKAREMGVKDV